MAPSFGQGPRDDDAVFLASDCDEQLLINLKFKQSVRLHSIAIKSLDADKAPKKIKLFVNPVNMSFDSAVRMRLLYARPRSQACSSIFLPACLIADSAMPQESDPCTQELDLTSDNVTEGSTVNLRYVKFQSVNSLSVGSCRERACNMQSLAQCACVLSVPFADFQSEVRRARSLTGNTRFVMAQIFCGSNFGDEEQTVIHRLVLFGLPGNLTDMNRWEEVAKKG